MIIISAEQIQLNNCYHYKSDYTKNHPHMIHKHTNCLEILYINKGYGKYIVDGVEYDVKAGDIVICNQGVLHGDPPFKDNAIETYCCAITNIRHKNFNPNCIISKRYNPILNSKMYATELSYLFKSMYNIFIKKKGINPVSKNISYAIFDIVMELLENQNDKKGQIDNNLIFEIISYLNLNFTKKITLQDLSDMFFVSPSTLSHSFKNKTGVSPIQYIIQRRLGEAQSLLLDTDIPINSIEESLGFSTSCHFSALFKRHIGISPKEYRKLFKRPKKKV